MPATDPTIPTATPARRPGSPWSISKALAADQHGVPCVGLGGVWA